MTMIIRRRRPHLADREYEMSPLNDPPTVVDREAGELEWGGERDAVCIYAAGLGREMAPLDSPDWVVWALNLVVPTDSRGRLRADLWWDIHQRRAQTDDDLRWIGSCPVPIVVPDDLMDAGPGTVALPLDRIMRRFPRAPFACTFAYQIAAAVLAGFTRIGLFGVELAYGSRRERTVEWACVNWWVGHVEALGVEVLRPHRTRLGRHPRLYGVEYDEEIEDTDDYLATIDRIAGLAADADTTFTMGEQDTEGKRERTPGR